METCKKSSTFEHALTHWTIGVHIKKSYTECTFNVVQFFQLLFNPAHLSLSATSIYLAVTKRVHHSWKTESKVTSIASLNKRPVQKKTNKFIFNKLIVYSSTGINKRDMQRALCPSVRCNTKQISLWMCEKMDLRYMWRSSRVVNKQMWIKISLSLRFKQQRIENNNKNCPLFSWGDNWI